MWSKDEEAPTLEEKVRVSAFLWVNIQLSLAYWMVLATAYLLSFSIERFALLFSSPLIVVHLCLMLMSLGLNLLAIMTKRAVFALVAAIGYTLTGFMGPTLVSTVLAWIGYVRQRKLADVEY